MARVRARARVRVRVRVTLTLARPVVCVARAWRGVALGSYRATLAHLREQETPTLTLTLTLTRSRTLILTLTLAHLRKVGHVDAEGG